MQKMNKKKAKQMVKKKFRKKLLEDNLNNIKRKSLGLKRKSENAKKSLRNIKIDNLTDQFTLREIEIPSIDLYQKNEKNEKKKTIHLQQSNSKTSLFNNSYRKKKAKKFSMKKSLIMNNIKNQNKNVSLRNIDFPKTLKYLHKRNSLSNFRNISSKSKNSKLFLHEEYSHFGTLKHGERKNNLKKNLEDENPSFINKIKKNYISEKIQKNLQNVNVNVNLNFRINQKTTNIKTKVNKFTFKNKLAKSNIFENKKIKKSAKKLKTEKKMQIDLLNSYNPRKSRIYNKSSKAQFPLKKKVSKIEPYKNYYLRPLLQEIKLYLEKSPNFKLENTKVLKHFFENFSKFQYITKLKLKAKSFIFPININLDYFSNKIKSKKFLVLDMDETLIFSSSVKINDFSIKIKPKKNVI